MTSPHSVERDASSVPGWLALPVWLALAASTSCSHCAVLTEREIDVLRMLGAGASNKDIGVKLFVSDNTVKYHLRNIFFKLGIKNRTEASILALCRGLAGP